MANVLVQEESLSNIADAIREKNESQATYKPIEMAGAIRELQGLPKSYILRMEDGTEIPAVLIEKKTVFTATANDIRKGKVAASESGVVVGEKVIPAYQTCQGSKYILPGEDMIIANLTTDNSYDYTKLQVVVCLFNKSISDSVATEIVSIENKTYNVRSIDALSTITKNHENKTIELGIVNNFDVPCVVRYFTYKEI